MPAKGACSKLRELWNSASQFPKKFSNTGETRQPPRPHPSASMPRYSMDLIQLIREVAGKRLLVRDVDQLCPFAPATSVRPERRGDTTRL